MRERGKFGQTNTIAVAGLAAHQHAFHLPAILLTLPDPTDLIFSHHVPLFCLCISLTRAKFCNWIAAPFLDMTEIIDPQMMRLFQPRCQPRKVSSVAWTTCMKVSQIKLTEMPRLGSNPKP